MNKSFQSYLQCTTSEAFNLSNFLLNFFFFLHMISYGYSSIHNEIASKNQQIHEFKIIQ